MRKYRKIAVFIALISLFYCVSLIQSTYAKYVTSTTGTANMTIAKWNIVVNNQDVVNNSNFSSTIVPTFHENENIKNGVIAPTSSGSFDITLNLNDVDVSLQYTIAATNSTNNTVEDLKIVSYSINGSEPIPYVGNISNQVLLNETNRTSTITFNVEWIEDSADGATMNNIADTDAAKNGTAAVDVNINFTQVR